MKNFPGVKGALSPLLLHRDLCWRLVSVQVQRTQHWLCAGIKPTLSHSLYVNADEVYLGDGCPVTEVESDVYYEFFYHPSDHSIVTTTFKEFVLFKTKIKYISRNSAVWTEMPLSCVLHKGGGSLCYPRLVSNSWDQGKLPPQPRMSQGLWVPNCGRCYYANFRQHPLLNEVDRSDGETGSVTR